MRRILSLVAAFGLSVASAASAADRWFATQGAVVDIDATGRVTQATLPASGFSLARQAALIERIKQIQFEPATRDGVAHASRAHISVSLEIKEVDSGLRIELSGAQLTPQLIDVQPPRYPPEALRRGASGEVGVRIDYDAEGRVQRAEVVSASSRIDAFSKAALKAVRTWRVVPEQVGEIGVPGSAVIPVRFTIATRGGPRTLRLDDGSRLQLHRSSPQHEGEMLASSVGIRSLDAAREPI
jgi:TonB family protein